MENAAFLKAIIDHAIDGIITTDGRGNIESINPSGCSLFDYREQDLIGQNISMLMPPPGHKRHDKLLYNFESIGHAGIIGKRREVIGLRRNGITFPFRLRVSEVQFSGRKIYTGFIHDLSREKEAEEKLRGYAQHLEEQVQERTLRLEGFVKELENAKEKVSLSLEKEKELGQLKSRFVSMASHEFRTPLSSIQLSAILIEKYAEKPDAGNITKHIVKIKASVANLTGILNGFLSLERLEADKIAPVLREFDLVAFAEEITEEMQLITKQNQQIIYQHTGTSGKAKLDPALLKNCIINLISNAIKYSGEDTFIEFNSKIKGHTLTIVVKDNGIGIPENDQKHLFEPFFRAHNTGNITGNGLGLNIVARYTKLMQGELTFTSKVNHGACFTLSFPISHE